MQTQHRRTWCTGFLNNATLNCQCTGTCDAVLKHLAVPEPDSTTKAAPVQADTMCDTTCPMVVRTYLPA